MFFLEIGPAAVKPALADDEECSCCQIEEPPIEESNKAVALALASDELHAWRASLRREGIHFDVGQRYVVFLGGDESHHLYQIAFLPNPLPPDEVSGVAMVVDTVSREVVASARIRISADQGNGRTLFVYRLDGEILEFPYQHDCSNINWACWWDCMLHVAPLALLCCAGSGCPAFLPGCLICLGCTGAAGGFCAIACP